MSPMSPMTSTSSEWCFATCTSWLLTGSQGYPSHKDLVTLKPLTDDLATEKGEGESRDVEEDCRVSAIQSPLLPPHPNRSFLPPSPDHQCVCHTCTTQPSQYRDPRGILLIWRPNSRVPTARESSLCDACFTFSPWPDRCHLVSTAQSCNPRGVYF
jgi:hypothetical protein